MHLSVAPSGITLLSQELIDEIIDYFDVFWEPEDYSDSWVKRELVYLQNCSLISRVFRSRAQKHLFTCIGIDVHSESIMAPSLGRLNNVFSTNPRLASHVKTFTLRIRETADLWSGCFSHPNFFACMSHMLRSGEIYSRRSGLKIYLTSPRDSKPIELPTIGLSIPKASVVPRGMISHITSIQIHDLHNVPIALFDSSCNLRTVDVFRIRLAPFEESKRIPVEMRPSIRELVVEDSEDFICRTGLRFDTLERLVFTGHFESKDLFTMRHIFANANSNLSSLEHLNFFRPDMLTWDLVETDLYLEIGVDFARIPNLRELTFRAVSVDETEIDVITALVQFLATVPTEHKLNWIDIFYDCSIYDASGGQPEDIERALRAGDWAAFDATIVRIANTAKHPLKLTMTTEYSIDLDENLTRAEVEKSRAKIEDMLENWGVKYSPRATGSPNLVMETFAQYTDDWNYANSNLLLRSGQELERSISPNPTSPGSAEIGE
ncbi:hypothetical protein M413DRAFT_434783 [Hebeloma cylindrosporum]|uniref:F-box domain-containing protein n=1 Tax=Hebeloma cylindrosporum TaxID=76867 RepID=A0A0C3CI37_HEBCY|nr:hypothetical protein M413DRAFT_434783 [Hebeloma cylindrosporum h7]